MQRRLTKIQPIFKHQELDPADKVFSQCIRMRDRECVRCHSKVEFNEKGLPTSHQNSHFIGRRNEAVRFDQRNCDTVCSQTPTNQGCQVFWEQEKSHYREFKKAQLGEVEYKKLWEKSNENVKRHDRPKILKILKEELKNLLKKPPIIDLIIPFQK